MKTQESKEIILNTEPNLTEFRTNIEGWVGRDGNFYGKRKDLAIYAGYTHKKCDNGHIYLKHHLNCPNCAELEFPERYLRLAEKEWDFETPLVIFDTDTYFFDVDSVFEYADEEEIDVESIDLVICVPNSLWKIDTDIWVDIFPEGFEPKDFMSKEFLVKLEELNKIIDNHAPISWTEGMFRTRVNKI